MRGALNAITYNGRQYRRTALTATGTFEATGSGVMQLAKALTAAATFELSAALTLTRARPLTASAVLEFSGRVVADVIRIPERIEFMRRPAGNRSFRRPPQTRVMRGEKST